MRVLIVHYNPLREGNGAGGAESAVHDQAKALRALGHEVEIEHEFPQQAYRRFKPDIIHFHTIHIGSLGLELLEWTQNRGIPHCLSLHDYWPFCLLPGEIVYCNGIPTPIEQVVVDSKVVASGEMAVVQDRFERSYDGEAVEITAQGMLPVRFTAEHPILVAKRGAIPEQRRRNNWRKYNQENGIAHVDPELLHVKAEWKAASEVEPGDYVGLKPITEEREWVIDVNSWQKPAGKGALRKYKPIAVDSDMAYVLGWYLAEGYSTDGGESHLSLGYDDDPFIGEIADILKAHGLGASIDDKPDVHSKTVRFGNRPLARFLREKFGTSAATKVVPEEVLLLPKDKLRAFLRGYIRGDGCHTVHGTNGRNRIGTVTASKSLALGIYLACLKMGVVPYIGRARAQEFEIRGKTHHSHGGYTLCISGQQQEKLGFKSGTTINKERFEWVDGMAWVPVKCVTKSHYSGRVYNLETSNHTFDVPFMTHNCTQGRMLLKRGDESCSAVHGVCDGDCEFGAPNPEVAKCVNGTPTVTFNPYSAEIYRRNGIRVDAMIPHGIDVDLFSPGDGGNGIVTSSAWPEYPTKGMHVLKAALAQIGESATLITGVPRLAVRDALRKGSIFVFPSCYQETFGLCLCEAMACGLTPVASDVCGARSQITHGVDGLLVPPRDGDALAGALRWLLDHQAERAVMGRAARVKAETQFNLQRMARDYERFYGEVIHG